MTVPPGIGLITHERRGSIPEGFRGYTLCVNLEEPQAEVWGGGFSWRDPEGNIWDVAWTNGSGVDERGGLRFP